MRLIFALALVLLMAACVREADPEQQDRVFCAALQRVNSGLVDTQGLAELQGHARVLETLLDAAPESIEPELEQFHHTFASWAAAVDGERSMRDTFDILTDPELAGAQGRIADYIEASCGLRIGDGRYTVAARPTAQDICPGWPGIGSPLTFNNFPNLPDISGANYFSNYFMVSRLGLTPGDSFAVEPGGRVEFRGRYPRARYFAYHPNDIDLNNLPTLRDRDLEPDAGSVNPFREIPQTGDSNYYTARLVFSAVPENPEPNTRYVGVRKDGESTNRFVMNLLRLYASDLGDGANSGGVPLPAVTIFDADGQVSEHFDECDLYARGGEAIRTELSFPELPIADHRARQEPRWSTSSNFEAPSDTLANADVQYLSTVYSRRFGDIFVVRGKHLSAPDTRAGVPVSAPGYDVRFYSLCNYNIWAGHAINCMLDTQLTVGEDGYYTLVIADADHRPVNLEREQATWMDWGPFLDGQLSFRHVFRENPVVVGIAAALQGEEVGAELAAYVPVAMPCTRERFERGGWRACLDP